MLPPDSQRAGPGGSQDHAPAADGLATGDELPTRADAPGGDGPRPGDSPQALSTAPAQVRPPASDQAASAGDLPVTPGSPGGSPDHRARHGYPRHGYPRPAELLPAWWLASRRTRRRPEAEPGGLPARSAEIAGSVLARLTTLPALLIVAWLVPGLPLLLAGAFLPVPMLLISVPLAVALVANVLRVIPAGWPRLLPADRSAEPRWAVWAGLLATIAVVAAITGWQLTESSAAVIVLRDPGTYLQTGYWIAQHGALPIPAGLSAFGGAHAGLNFATTGFLARGSALYPAVQPGLPMLLAGAFWVHGISAATAAGPVLGGLAMLSFAGLVARLVGPQWAPVAAGVLGLSLPEQYVSRTSLSETTLQILLFGGLSLLADSVAVRGWLPAAGWRGARLTPQRVLAGAAGLALGFGFLISFDVLVYLLPVIPFGCVLVLGRRLQAAPFLIGTGFGVCFGVLGCYLADRPFLDTVGHTVALSGVVAIWLVALAMVGYQLGRVERLRGSLARLITRRPLRWLPEAGAALTLAATAGFIIRPYVQVVHGHPGPGEYHFIAALQRLQGLPVDPTRLYSEQTLYWVIWYVGLPTVLLGAFGLALAVRACLRALLTWQDPAGIWRMWALPLAIICAGSAAVLWAPDIDPDQPWASRRLIVMVIPGLILAALWAASWLARRARDRGAQPSTAALAGLFCAAAMLVPTVSTTFGLGFSHTGRSGGLHPVAQGLALSEIGKGETGAVRNLCAQLPRNSAVVILDWPTASGFAQVIRGMCGVPVGWMAGQPKARVESVVGSIRTAGRRPLLLASSARGVSGFGGSPVRVLDLATTGDPHELTQLPTSPVPIRFQIWLSAPPAGKAGT